jgi:hypothetical protein
MLYILLQAAYFHLKCTFRTILEGKSTETLRNVHQKVTVHHIKCDKAYIAHVYEALKM